MTIHSSGKAWTTSTRQAATEVDSAFPRAAWTSTYPGHGEIYPAIRSQANLGQYAIDYMISSKAMGDAIAKYIVADMLGENRLGTRYVIWFRRIISLTGPTPRKWRTYINPVPSRRGTASGDHTNHVHQSRYSNKGYRPLTVPVEPGPVHIGYPTPRDKIVYVSKLEPGQADSDSVFWVQVALGIKATGTYDQPTVDAVKAFQKSLGDDVDGDLGQLQTAALFAAHKVLGVRVEAKP